MFGSDIHSIRSDSASISTCFSGWFQKRLAPPDTPPEFAETDPHPEDRDELLPLFDAACRNAPHWLVQSNWDIAERFTYGAFTAHVVGIERDGFRYAGGIKSKIDCNAIYRLIDHDLWWPLHEGKRLAIIGGHAAALAAKLTEAEFVRATGGDGVTWSIATTVSCPPFNQPKHTHWSRMLDELFATERDLLLCSSGALSAVICEVARHRGRRAIDVGALDVAFLGSGSEHNSPQSFELFLVP